MDTKYWLEAEWTSLFSKALAYPKVPTLESEHDYKRYFVDLQFVLPGSFKHEYASYMQKIPVEPFLRGGRDHLAHWVLKIHNSYQRYHGGKIMTLDEAIQTYLG